MSAQPSHCPFCRARIETGTVIAATRCGACLRLLPPAAQPSAVAADSTAAIRARAHSTHFASTEDHEFDGSEAAARDSLSALASEPLEMLQRRQRGLGALTKRLALGVMAALLLGAFGAQLLWANRATYQHKPRLYPAFVAACELIGCAVPLYRDIASLSAEGLSVEADPAQANTLVVSFRLANEAPLPQAAPVLILSFNTAANRSVAVREFAPEEYLPARIDARRPLGAGRSIGVSLALVDPGPEAVNYTVAFRAR